MTIELLTIDMGNIKYMNPKIIEKTVPAKLSTEPSNPTTDEFKEPNLKYNLSKFEYDLYHEEDDIPNPVIRVKRFSMPNKGEKWKVMIDNKAMFIVEGTKLSKKEREFLRTIDGVNFLIALYKNGINSFNHFKTELKKKIK